MHLASPPAFSLFDCGSTAALHPVHPMSASATVTAARSDPSSAGGSGLEARACPHCGHSAHGDTRIERDIWRVVSCAGCGFVYLAEIPPLAAFAGEFAWDKTVEEEKVRRKEKQRVIQWLDTKTRWRLHMFKRPETSRFLQEMVEAGPVLDLGCGNGKHAMNLPEAYTPYGIEIAPNLAREADTTFKTRGGYCIAADSYSGLAQFEDGFFAGAMLNSYLEHDPNPMPVLTALAPKMRPGAPVIVKVPNYGSWNAKVMGANWCGVRLPDHVNYFTPESLRAMAASAGYTVETPSGVNLPTNDNTWMFLYARQA